jgi:Tfp pilus assembly protein PilN
MINLLPPEVKDQVAYSKRNAILLKYINATIILTLIAGAGLTYGVMHINGVIASTDAEIAASNKLVASDKKIELQAKAINDRLAAIQKIQSNQAKFSLLLKDIAGGMPRGTAIESIALDGDDKKPVRISGSAQNYESAAVVASGLSKLERVSEARTEGIEANTQKKTFQFVVLVTFKPGQSR